MQAKKSQVVIIISTVIKELYDPEHSMSKLI